MEGKKRNITDYFFNQMFFSLVERLPIVSMGHKCVVLCFELLCASISRV